MASTIDFTPGSTAAGGIGGSGDGNGGNGRGKGDGERPGASCGCPRCLDIPLSKQDLVKALMRWLRKKRLPAAFATERKLEEYIEKALDKYNGHIKWKREKGPDVQVNIESEPQQWPPSTGLCACLHCTEGVPSEEEIIGALIRIAAEVWSDVSSRLIQSRGKEMLDNMERQVDELAEISPSEVDSNNEGEH